MLNMMEEAGKDPTIRKLVADPYVLYPEGIAAGPDGADQMGTRFDEDFQQWTSPFVMAVVNTRVVRRSNALMGFPWGEDFRYDESLLSSSRLKATGVALASGAGIAALALSPTRKLAQRFLPAPGEGPNKKQREAGFYEIFFYAVHPTSSEKDMLGKSYRGYGSRLRLHVEDAWRSRSLPGSGQTQGGRRLLDTGFSHGSATCWIAL